MPGSYSKTTWVPGVTPLSAANLNKLETQYEEFTKLYGPHSILIAIVDDTPVILTIPASRVVGRKAAGNIIALTGAEVLAIIGRVGKGNLEWTADKLLLGAGVGVDPTLIDVPNAATRSWLLDQLADDALPTAVIATVALFQANAGTGTFSLTPENINDNNTANNAGGTNVGEYAEVDFQKLVVIRRWRQFYYPCTGDGRFKLQYWDLDTEGWLDWVTDIPTGTVAEWGDMTTEIAKLTTKIRLEITTLDSTWTRLRELEVIY